LRFDERGTVQEVEPPHDFASELEVRQLILPDRHGVRANDRDID